MRQLRFNSLAILPSILFFAAGLVINSSVYDWEKLVVKKTSEGEIRNILSGPTQTLDNFVINAITLKAGGSIKEFTVPAGNDELIILKEGSAGITVNGKEEILGEGSVAVAGQGDKIVVRNPDKKNSVFYTFLFKAKTSGTNQPSKVSPVLKEWNTIEFKPNANGGRRDIIKQATSSLKELEMHTTMLNAGLPSHAAHNHPDEEIILVRFGYVEETINDKPFKLGPGSVIFITNKDNHGIRNAGNDKCEYYAIRWLTSD